MPVVSSSALSLEGSAIHWTNGLVSFPLTEKSEGVHV